MVETFIGSLLLVPYNFVPQGWAACNGQTMQIVQNQALFSLLSNTYGGDGRETFGLPNMPAMKDANGNPLNWIICVDGIYPSRQ